MTYQEKIEWLRQYRAAVNRERLLEGEMETLRSAAQRVTACLGGMPGAGQDPDRLPIRLDPGMIFGTGAHASTQMCMMALEENIHGGETVLDLGSGSGILSITALVLGAASAIGVDIDPKAEDIARENAAFNGIGTDRFTAVTGDVIADQAMMERLAGQYDIVLANIVADVIIPLSSIVPRFLKPEGVFICSGILDRRLEDVRQALHAAGLWEVSVRTLEDWCQITCKIRQGG